MYFSPAMIISWSEGDVLLKRWHLMFDVLNHVTCLGGVEVGELLEAELIAVIVNFVAPGPVSSIIISSNVAFMQLACDWKWSLHAHFPHLRAGSLGANTTMKLWGFLGSEDTTKWSDGDGRTSHNSHQYARSVQVTGAHPSSWDSSNEGTIIGCPFWTTFWTKFLKRQALLTLWTLYVVKSVRSFQWLNAVWPSRSLQKTRMLAGGGEEHEGEIQKARISKEEE